MEKSQLRKKAEAILEFINDIDLEELNTKKHKQETQLLKLVYAFTQFRTLTKSQQAKFLSLTEDSEENSTFDLPEADTIPGPLKIGFALAILERLAQKAKITVEEVEEQKTTSTEHEIVYYQDELNLTKIKQLTLALVNKLDD